MYWKRNNSILLVGYCGDQTLGGQLLGVSRKLKSLVIHAMVKAEIGQIQGMSAHGDCDDLCRFISNQDSDAVKGIFLVHGEYSIQKAFVSKLELKGFKGIEIPTMHQEYELVNENEKVKAA